MTHLIIICPLSHRTSLLIKETENSIDDLVNEKVNLKKELLTVRSDNKDSRRKLEMEHQKMASSLSSIAELKSSLKRETEKQAKHLENDAIKKDLQKKV